MNCATTFASNGKPYSANARSWISAIAAIFAAGACGQSLRNISCVSMSCSVLRHSVHSGHGHSQVEQRGDILGRLTHCSSGRGYQLIAALELRTETPLVVGVLSGPRDVRFESRAPAELIHCDTKLS